MNAIPDTIRNPVLRDLWSQAREAPHKPVALAYGTENAARVAASRINNRNPAGVWEGYTATVALDPPNDARLQVIYTPGTEEVPKKAQDRRTLVRDKFWRKPKRVGFGTIQVQTSPADAAFVREVLWAIYKDNLNVLMPLFNGTHLSRLASQPPLNWRSWQVLQETHLPRIRLHAHSLQAHNLQYRENWIEAAAWTRISQTIGHPGVPNKPGFMEIEPTAQVQLDRLFDLGLGNPWTLASALENPVQRASIFGTILSMPPPGKETRFQHLMAQEAARLQALDAEAQVQVMLEEMLPSLEDVLLPEEAVLQVPSAPAEPEDQPSDAFAEVLGDLVARATPLPPSSDGSALPPSSERPHLPEYPYIGAKEGLRPSGLLHRHIGIPDVVPTASGRVRIHDKDIYPASHLDLLAPMSGGYPPSWLPPVEGIPSEVSSASLRKASAPEDQSLILAAHDRVGQDQEIIDNLVDEAVAKGFPLERAKTQVGYIRPYGPPPFLYKEEVAPAFTPKKGEPPFDLRGLVFRLLLVDTFGSFENQKPPKLKFRTREDWLKDVAATRVRIDEELALIERDRRREARNQERAAAGLRVIPDKPEVLEVVLDDSDMEATTPLGAASEGGGDDDRPVPDRVYPLIQDALEQVRQELPDPSNPPGKQALLDLASRLTLLPDFEVLDEAQVLIDQTRALPSGELVPASHGLSHAGRKMTVEEALAVFIADLL